MDWFGLMRDLRLAITIVNQNKIPPIHQLKREDAPSTSRATPMALGRW